MTRRRRALGALLTAVSVAAVAAGLGAPTPAAAQQAGVELVAQTPWVEPDGTVTMLLEVAGPPDAEVAASVHQRVGTGAELRAAAAGELGSVLGAVEARPVDTMTTRADGAVELRVGLRAGDGPAELVRITGPGVYPVRVELRTPAGEPLDGFTTFLVRLPASGVADPLPVAAVLALTGAPLTGADGTAEVTETVRAATATLAGALEAHPSTPLTLAVAGELLDALASSPDGVDAALLASLAGALGGRPVVAAPYVSVDPVALVAEGRPGEVAAQLDRSEVAVVDTLGVVPLTDTVVTGELDAATVTVLADAGRTRAVVPSEGVGSTSGVLTAPVGLRGDDGAVITVAGADAGLSSRWRQGAVGAQTVLATLALEALGDPDTVTSGGAVTAPPPGWQPEPRFLAGLLGGLSTPGPLVGVGLETWFDTVGVARSPDGEAIVLPANTVTRPSGRGGLERLEETRAAVTSLAGMLSAVDPLPDQLATRLLVASATELTAAERQAVVDGVRAELAATISTVSVGDQQSLTLTSRSADLPVTLVNDGPPVTVRLRLVSDRLEAVEPVVLTLDEPTTVVRVPVEVRVTGEFGVRALVESPDGGLLVAETNLTVRSTAVPGLGIAIAAVSLLFLIGWWVTHHRRHRHDTPRGRHAAPSAAEPAGDGSGGGAAEPEPSPARAPVTVARAPVARR